MSTVEAILQLEEELRLAELTPDPLFFEGHLAERAVLDGEMIKAKVVEAHRPAATPKFTRVEMSDMRIVDHGDAAVVTCVGTYEGPAWSGALRFMRVWLRRDDRWEIVAATTTPVA